MSCGNPAAGGEEALMQRRTKFDKSTWCIKCKEQRGNIVIRHTVYCKTCFFPLVTTKFRRCIEPHINESSKVSKRNGLKASGNLLVGFSGGLGSTVLLDLMTSTYFPSVNGSMNGKGGKGHPRNKRVWTKAYVCYVEASSAFPGIGDRSADIQRFFEDNENFELVTARIEYAFDPNWWDSMGQGKPEHALSASFGSEGLPLFPTLSSSEDGSQSPAELLRTYLSSLPTRSAEQSTISLLTRLILTFTAHRLHCSHLALGTSLTSLSISLITSISQGGGFNLRDEYFEEWHEPSSVDRPVDRPNPISVRIVRPLHDVGMKECAAWAYWKRLSIVGREKSPGISVKQTIGSLTKNFIIGLERDYPSTVSTIVRTCSKVEAKDEVRDRCALCQKATPSGIQDWKSRISVRSLRPDRPDSNHPHPQTDSESGVGPGPELLSYRLCYACHTHLTSRSSRSATTSNKALPLPQWTNALLLNASKESSSNSSRLRIDGNEAEEIWSGSVMSQEKMKAVVDGLLL